MAVKFRREDVLHANVFGKNERQLNTSVVKLRKKLI